MTLSQLGTVMVLNFVGMATPGPDIFLITRLATRSRRHALASVFGIATGLIVWVTLTVLGAAALLSAYPQILGLVQLIGGAWILWMGYKMLRSALDQFKYPGVLAEEPDELFGTAWNCYRQGLITNLSNPKVVLYFAAIIAPLMPREPSLGTVIAIVVAIVMSAIVGFGALAMLISTNRLRSKFLKAGPYIDFVAGIFFLIAGCGLVIAGALDLTGITG